MPEYVPFNQFRDHLHGAKLGTEVDRHFGQFEARSAMVGPSGAAGPTGGAGPSAASRPARREAFAAELDKMLGYLRRYYHTTGGAEHTFLDPSGNFVDCIPFADLPMVRAAAAAGAAVVDQGPRPSGVEADPPRRGFDRPPTPAHVVPLLRRGLVDRFGKRLACPDGCVPVARLTADDMTRAGSFDRFFAKVDPGQLVKKGGGKGKPAAKAAKGGKKPGRGKGGAVSPLTSSDSKGKLVLPQINGHAYANTFDGPNGSARPPYFGCTTGLSVRQPTIPFETTSISQLWMLGDTMSNGLPQTVESGWMVYERLFGTNAPVLFVFVNPDGYGPRSGYVTNPNDLSGFVPAPDAPFVIGQHGFLAPPSSGGGPTAAQLFWEFFDTSDPGWHLYHGHVGQNLADFTRLGYIPARLYAGTALQTHCLNVQFGGEVGGLDRANTGPSPGFTEMGSGIAPTTDALFNFNNVAFQCDVKVQTTKNAPMVPAALNQLRVDTGDGFGLNFPTDPAFSSYFFFGGRKNL